MLPLMGLSSKKYEDEAIDLIEILAEIVHITIHQITMVDLWEQEGGAFMM